MSILSHLFHVCAYHGTTYADWPVSAALSDQPQAASLTIGQFHPWRVAGLQVSAWSLKSQNSLVADRYTSKRESVRKLWCRAFPPAWLQVPIQVEPEPR